MSLFKALERRTFSIHCRTEDKFLLLLLFSLWTVPFSTPISIADPDPSLIRGAFFPCTQAIQGFYAASLSERDKRRWTLVRPKGTKEGQEMQDLRGIRIIRRMSRRMCSQIVANFFITQAAETGVELMLLFQRRSKTENFFSCSLFKNYRNCSVTL